MKNQNILNLKEMDYKVENSHANLACKLTSPELQKRKATVLMELKSKISDTNELENGYSFSFAGTNKALDELLEFVKTERECCDFFIFGLIIDKDKIELKITGPKGVKTFISDELGLVDA